MKRKGDLFNELLDYSHIKNVYNTISSNARDKENIYRFGLNLNQNFFSILSKLYNEKYEFSKYRIFLIKDPKYRLIMSETISDKIVNHLVANYVLLPSLEKSLIDTNVATRKNRGSSYAFNAFGSYVNNMLMLKKNYLLFEN